MVLQAWNIAADLSGNIVSALMVEQARLIEPVEVVRIETRRFKLLRSDNSVNGAMPIITALEGHYRHEADGALALLRFVARRFGLDFLDNRQVNDGPEGAVDALKSSKTAEGPVSDVHAVCY